MAITADIEVAKGVAATALSGAYLRIMWVQPAQHDEDGSKTWICPYGVQVWESKAARDAGDSPLPKLRHLDAFKVSGYDPATVSDPWAAAYADLKTRVTNAEDV